MHVTDLPETDIVAGTPRITTAERTAWDIARFVDVVDAVAYLDALVAGRVIRVSDLVLRLENSKVAWGRKRVARAIDLIHPRAESPQESRLRVKFIVDGLPRPVAQYVVRAAGEFVARLDLAWPEARVAVEYDGIWHSAAERFHPDRQRMSRLAGLGWTVFQ